MSCRPLTERRGFHVALAVAIGGLLLGGAGAAYFVGAGTHPLTVNEAVRRYREGASPSPTSSSTTSVPTVLPTSTTQARGVSTKPPSSHASTSGGSRTPAHPDMPQGVYVYATQGYDETDALSGQRHDYPDRTTYATKRAGCHWISRWQPVAERWDESEACKTATGITLKRFSMYHEFFHEGVREDFLCGSNAVVMPWEQTPGDSWTFQCRSRGSTLDMTVRVVGFESIAVGDRSVRAVHVRYDGNVQGDDQGTEIQDRWLDPKTGWFLRIISAADASVASPVGRAHYHERYRIDLTSLKPES